MRLFLHSLKRHVLLSTVVMLMLTTGCIIALHFYWQSPRGRMVALHRQYVSVLTHMLKHSRDGNRNKLDPGQYWSISMLPQYAMNTRIPGGMDKEEFETLTTAVFRNYMDTHEMESPVFLSYSKPAINDYDSYICPSAEVMEALQKEGYPADYGHNGERPADQAGFGSWGTELCILAIDQAQDGSFVVALSSEAGCLGETEIAYVATDAAGGIESIVWHSQLVDEVLKGLDERQRLIALGLRYF